MELKLVAWQLVLVPPKLNLSNISAYLELQCTVNFKLV